MLVVEELGDGDRYAGCHSSRPNYPTHQASLNFHHVRLNFGNALVEGTVLALILQGIVVEPRGDVFAGFGVRLHCHAHFPYFDTLKG